MDEFSFSPRFLQELAEWEQTASPKDRAQLDHILAAIVQNPTLAGRAPSFYDPLHSKLSLSFRVCAYPFPRN